VLSWIDICAGLAAKTVARGPVVTASVDTVHFLRPCRLGSVAIVAAMVNRTFQSSMEARPPPSRRRRQLRWGGFFIRKLVAQRPLLYR
jgi:acyl-coenzyme A thioesterase PaaI-like protein